VALSPSELCALSDQVEAYVNGMGRDPFESVDDHGDDEDQARSIAAISELDSGLRARYVSKLQADAMMLDRLAIQDGVLALLDDVETRELLERVSDAKGPTS
jgi:hypothetical protein